jgi:hypothetical protein
MAINKRLPAALVFLSVVSMPHGLTLGESRTRLSQAISSPSGKLTLSPELIIPDPADMTAILLQNNAIQTMSAQIRAAKANAVFLQGSILALKTFCTEQESVRGGFPGPLPLIYCSKVDDNGVQQVADAGADGLLVSLNHVLSSSDLSGALQHDSTFVETTKAALKCGLQPIPEIIVDDQGTKIWKELDTIRLVEQLTELMGAEPVNFYSSLVAQQLDTHCFHLDRLLLSLCD